MPPALRAGFAPLALCLASCTAVNGPADLPEGAIAFVGENDLGRTQLFVTRADGAGLAPILEDAFDYSGPSWSPDRSSIVVSSNRDGNADWNIFVIHLDTRAVDPLVRGPGAQFAPAWSPDGGRIAFQQVAVSDNGWDIFVVNADGTGLRNLTDGLGDQEMPAWSPDGGKIAYQAIGAESGIFVMNADGTGRTRLIDQGPGATGAPSWSPDGSRIAFESTRHRDAPRFSFGQYEIYIMAATGAEARRLTAVSDSTHAARFPSWSPDGGWIAFEFQKEVTSATAFRYRVALVNADGSDVHEVPTGRRARFPRWAP